MKTKKILAVALAAGMLIGGGTKALDLAIPTAYATEEKSLDQLKTELKEAQEKKADLEHKKAFNEKKLADYEKLLEDQTIDWQRRARLNAYKKSAEEELAKVNKELPEVNKQIADLEAKIKNATPAEVFTIEVTTTKPDGSVAKTTVTGKDVNEAKQNVTNAAEKIDGYKINIKFSADNKTATVTYVKKPEKVNKWDVNVSLQIYSLTGQLWQDVPGATITLTNNDTGALVHTYTTTTDNDGRAHAEVLEGNYTLTVTSLPTGGVLAGKTYRWQGTSSKSIKIEGPTSEAFYLEELSTVTYRFKDTEGNVIAPEETTQLNRTGVFQLEENGLPQPKAIENYKFVKVEQDGDIYKGSGTFTYVYEALIYTRFVDPSGNDIAPKEYGIKEFKIIKGYKWIKTEKDEKGNVTHIYLPEYPDDDSTTTTTEETNKDNETKPEGTKPEDKPEDGKDNSDENKAKDLIDKLNKNTAEIEKILKENEANQDKEPDKKPDEKPDKKPEKKPEKDNKGKKSNPKTGVAGISLVAGSLAVASAALVATKKENK